VDWNRKGAIRGRVAVRRSDPPHAWAIEDEADLSMSMVVMREGMARGREEGREKEMEGCKGVESERGRKKKKRRERERERKKTGSPERQASESPHRLTKAQGKKVRPSLSSPDFAHCSTCDHSGLPEDNSPSFFPSHKVGMNEMHAPAFLFLFFSFDLLFLALGIHNK